MKKITAFAPSARRILAGVPTTISRRPFPSQPISTAAAALHRRATIVGQIHPSPHLFFPDFRNARAHADDSRSDVKREEESDDLLLKGPINSGQECADDSRSDANSDEESDAKSDEGFGYWRPENPIVDGKEPLMCEVDPAASDVHLKYKYDKPRVDIQKIMTEHPGPYCCFVL